MIRTPGTFQGLTIPAVSFDCHGREQGLEILLGTGGLGVGRGQGVSAQGQRAPVQGLCFPVSVLVAVQVGKAVQGVGQVGMLGAKHLVDDCQGDLVFADAVRFSSG